MKTINKIGKTFGRLTVLGLANTEHKRPFVVCKCSCGKNKEIDSVSLTRTKQPTRSCGCLRIEQQRLEKGEANFNRLYIVYKREALKRGINFVLDKKQFKHFNKQECYYCGIEPKQIYKSTRQNGVYIYNGIDRVDNDKGYYLDNCVSCCGICNYMKGANSKSLFLKQIRKINNNIYDKENRLLS